MFFLEVQLRESKAGWMLVSETVNNGWDDEGHVTAFVTAVEPLPCLAAVTRENTVLNVKSWQAADTV